MATYGIKFGEENIDFWKFSNTAQGVYLNKTTNNDGLYTIWDVSSPDIYISKIWFDDVIEKI